MAFPNGQSTTRLYNGLVIRLVVAVIVLVSLGVAGSLYINAGNSPGPTIAIHQPIGFIGGTSHFEVSIDSGDGLLTSATGTVEQNGISHPLFTLSNSTQANITQETETRIRVIGDLTRELYPELAPGPVSIVVRASRSVLFGLREQESTARLDLEARFDPPRLSVASSFHYINHGGAELVGVEDAS